MAEAEAEALDASNRGFRLLQKMGWMQGTGLGKHSQGSFCSDQRTASFFIRHGRSTDNPRVGIVEPVRMKENLVCLGLGKAVRSVL